MIVANKHVTIEQVRELIPLPPAGEKNCHVVVYGSAFACGGCHRSTNYLWSLRGFGKWLCTPCAIQVDEALREEARDCEETTRIPRDLQ